MWKDGPLGFGYEFGQIFLNFGGIQLFGKTKPFGDTFDMSVYHHSLIDAKGVSEDDVGRLTTYSGQLDEIVHCRRNLPSMSFYELLGHVDD
jgi:hypothetical protein